MFDFFALLTSDTANCMFGCKEFGPKEAFCVSGTTADIKIFFIPPIPSESSILMVFSLRAEPSSNVSRKETPSLVATPESVSMYLGNSIGRSIFSESNRFLTSAIFFGLEVTSLGTLVPSYIVVKILLALSDIVFESSTAFSIGDFSFFSAALKAENVCVVYGTLPYISSTSVGFSIWSISAAFNP